MLHELTIENFALLAHVHIRFGAGLNVLTGETGAGKSIIIDAISRVLGSRGGADDVRSGATHAHIEAVFALAEPPAALHALLAERGLLDADDDGQAPDTGPLDLILTRDIRPNGRSVGRVNGRAVPLHTVAALGRFLLDIHGQTEHLSLLQPATPNSSSSTASVGWRRSAPRYATRRRRSATRGGSGARCSKTSASWRAA